MVRGDGEGLKIDETSYDRLMSPKSPELIILSEETGGL